MKKFLILLFAITTSVNLSAQQTINSDNISDFTAIELAGKLTAELTQGETNSIDIQLNNTDITKIEWGVKNGVLFVKLKAGRSDATADVKICYKNINELNISGANVSVKTAIKCQMLDINLSAGATLGAKIETLDLAVKATGNSVAILSGESKYCTFHTGARSRIDSRELSAMDANVTATSASEIYVNAEERITMYSELNSSIFYKGNPIIKRSNTKLMGEVFSLDSK